MIADFIEKEWAKRKWSIYILCVYPVPDIVPDTVLYSVL